MTAILLAVCAARAETRTTPTDTPGPPVKREEVARLVHIYINEERVKKSLSPLAWDERLGKIALGHSADMTRRKYFAHESPEGDGFVERYHRAAYVCRIQVGRTIYGGAENIALGYTYSSVSKVNGVMHYDWKTSEKIARKTVEGWMKSRGHRENILTPHWKREGIGVVISPDDKVYITQDFC